MLLRIIGSQLAENMLNSQKYDNHFIRIIMKLLIRPNIKIGA